MFSSRAALMSLIIASTCSGQALANESVSFAMNSWIGYAPLFVASAKGYFGDYNIKYIHIEQGINAALLSRDVDMADLSMNQVIMDNIKGSKIKVFMPIDYSNGADQIISKTSIKNIKDLKGLTIPLDIGSYSELLLAYALQQNGLSIRDIKMKDVPASDVPSVLLGNRAKVGVTWAPHTEVILSHPGYKTLYSSREAPGLISDSLCANSVWISDHKNASEAIITGFLKGENYIYKHPKKAFNIVGNYLGISPIQARREYNGVINPSVSEMRYMMTGEGKHNHNLIDYKKSINIVTDLMNKTNVIKSRVYISPDLLLYQKYVVKEEGLS